MNDRFEHLMYQAGMTAQGCWDEMDSSQREAVEKFAELLILECSYLADQAHYKATGAINGGGYIRRHFDIQVLK